MTLMLITPNIVFGALTDNLVSYWKLDESSGNASDAHGAYTLTNNNTVTYTTSFFNNGISSGASNTTRNMTNTSALGIAGNGEITISGWVYYSSLPGAGSKALWGHTSTTGTDNYFWLNSETTDLRISTNYSSFCSVAHGFSTGTWYYITVTRTGNAFEIFKNGTSLTTCNSGGASPISQTRFSILSAADGSSEYSSDIQIDEVGVWSRVLTGTEISDLYNSGSGLAYPFTASTPVLSPVNKLVKFFWFF